MNGTPARTAASKANRAPCAAARARNSRPCALTRLLFALTTVTATLECAGHQLTRRLDAAHHLDHDVELLAEEVIGLGVERQRRTLSWLLRIAHERCDAVHVEAGRGEARLAGRGQNGHRLTDLTETDQTDTNAAPRQRRDGWRGASPSMRSRSPGAAGRIVDSHTRPSSSARTCADVAWSGDAAVGTRSANYRGNEMAVDRGAIDLALSSPVSGRN